MPIAVDQRSRARQSREELRSKMIETARELLRTRAYAELTVDDVMRPTGQGRTVFYRHFDDLPDLLRHAARPAIEALFEAQAALAEPLDADHDAVIERSLTKAVEVYSKHGPLIRGIVEAAAADDQLSAGQDALRRRFDDLTERVLRVIADRGGAVVADPAQTARALTLMNERYLLDAFGHEPRVTPEVAVRTLTEVWTAVFEKR